MPINNKCWYNKVCNLVDTDECTQYCTRYYKMKQLMDIARIPENMQKIIELNPAKSDIESFKELALIKSNIDKFVTNGNNLYIYSKFPGNGKTSWAIKLIQSYLNYIWVGTEIKERALFIHFPTYINSIMDKVSGNSSAYNEVKNAILVADLVVWDFIPVNSITPYQRSQILTQLDTRMINRQSNIFTGTLGIDRMSEYIGEDLSSRIYNGSKVIEIYSSTDRRASIDFSSNN